MVKNEGETGSEASEEAVGEATEAGLEVSDEAVGEATAAGLEIGTSEEAVGE